MAPVAAGLRHWNRLLSEVVELPAIPEGVQEKGTCCTERCGLVSTVLIG